MKGLGLSRPPLTELVPFHLSRKRRATLRTRRRLGLRHREAFYYRGKGETSFRIVLAGYDPTCGGAGLQGSSPGGRDCRPLEPMNDMKADDSFVAALAI